MESIQKFQSQQFNRYQYILENIKDVIWEMDKDYFLTFMSPSSKDMSGYLPEEMVGHQITEFLTEASKLFFVDRVKLGLKRQKKEEKFLLYDLQFICKNGTIIWVEVSVNPLFAEGKFAGYIGTTRNSMERKEHEYQLNQYVEELKKLNAQLEKTAVTDTLTGIYNRRKFDEDLNLIIDRQETHKDQFSLLLFDIDHFKSVNDGFGHETGDLVLQRITELVASHIRRSDRFFRWGGEEFMIILHGSNRENAKKIAEKIRDLIANENFGIEKQITVSFGVGEIQEEENADQLIARVDKLLYQAKMQGGNTVVG